MCFRVLIIFLLSLSLVTAKTNAPLHSLKINKLFISSNDFEKLSNEEKLIYLISSQFLAAELSLGSFADKNSEKFVSIKNSSFNNSFLFVYWFHTDAMASKLDLVRLGISPAGRAAIAAASSRFVTFASRWGRVIFKASPETLKLLSNNILIKQKELLLLLKKEKDLLKSPKLNEKLITETKEKITNAKRELQKASAEFIKNGGSQEELKLIAREAEKTILSKTKDLAITSFAAYGAYELLDDYFSQGHDDLNLSNPQMPALPTPENQKNLLDKNYTRLMEHKEGNPCLYGLYPSKIVNKSGKLSCERPADSQNKMCNPDQFYCPPLRLTYNSKFKTDDKIFCITHLPILNLGQRCSDLYLKNINEFLTLFKDTQSFNAALDRESLMTFIQEIHNLAKIQFDKKMITPNENKDSSLTIGDYCELIKTKIISEPQKRECEAVLTYVSALKNTKVYDLIFQSNSNPISSSSGASFPAR